MTFTQIRLFTAFASLLLSVSIYYFDDIINSDGIMYMEMVQAYMQGGLAAMADIFGWPFFTLLVAWLSQLLSSPIEWTASALNSVLFVLFTDALLLISRLLLPNLRQTAIAAVLILAFYTINDYRDFIIRDIGYWAFVSLALYQLICYQSKQRLGYAIGWQLSILVAILFRIEGIVMLALLPLFAFYQQTWQTGLRRLLQLNCVVVPLALCAFIVMLGAEGWGQAFSKFDDFLAYLNTDALQARAEQRLSVMEKQVLSPFSAEYSGLILYSGLLVMLGYKLIEGLSIGYALLLLIAWWQNRQQELPPYRSLLIWFICVNLLILAAFLFRHYFVTGRYCVMAVTGIFLLILPYLTNLIEQCWLSRRRWLLGFIGFIVLAGLIDTFHSTNSKAYIKNTGIWAAHELQASDRLLTDDEFIQYYLQREQTPVTVTYRRHRLGNYRQFDYLLVVEKGRQAAIKPLKGVSLKLVYHEENRRGNRASVYKIVKSRD